MSRRDECPAATLEVELTGCPKRFGARTEPYRVLSDRSVRRVLQKAGFRVRGEHRQFVLPIALHKAIGSRRFTLWSEHVLDRAGLLKSFGSPVTLVAERCAS